MLEAPPITVLNVNDDEVARYTIGRTLRRAGFVVREAGTGAEALRLVLAEKPDVVVLDVKLPDLSGFEVCHRIKTNPATSIVPVLLTSAAFVRAENRVQGLDGGADAYLVQPAEAIELVATVRALVRTRRAEEQRATSLRSEQVARAAAESARAQAEEARLQAEYANRLKDEFLATVSHELRTPLNAILGWSRMLRGGHVANDRVADVLATIERNANAQAQLIEDLLDVSRILAGKLRVEFRAVDLGTLVASAVDAVRPTAETKGLTIDVTVSSGAASVVGDADRLQQVAWNLLSNAVKFTPRGGSIDVRVFVDDDEAVLRVTDSGAGIREDFLPFVFDRFRQADSTISRSHSGLGLGLAIVRHLVELHGGQVHAASDGAGRGATFTVRLPRRNDIPEFQPPASPFSLASRPNPIGDLPSLDGLHVLVVEDEDDTRDLLAQVLAHQGARVTVASCVRDAIEAMIMRPDVIVSDIGMPGEDGYELIRRVRSRSADDGGLTPAVAVTAFARSDDRRRALAAGFHRHAAKPIEPEALVSLVATLAGRA